jgi:hypothetical protein
VHTGRRRRAHWHARLYVYQLARLVSFFFSHPGITSDGCVASRFPYSTRSVASSPSLEVRLATMRGGRP